MHDAPTENSHEMLLDLEDVTVVSATLPLDLLTAKRIVELRVSHDTTSIELFAEVRGDLERVEIPGGAFVLGGNSARLLLELLKFVTGARFEPRDPVVTTAGTFDVFRRADRPR